MKKYFILFLSYSLLLSSVNPVFAKKNKKAKRRTALGRSLREQYSSNAPAPSAVENIPAPTPAVGSLKNTETEQIIDDNVTTYEDKLNKIDTLDARSISLQGGQKELLKKQDVMDKQLNAISEEAKAATKAANLVLQNAEAQKKKEFAKKEKEIKLSLATLNGKIEEARSVCSGISGALNTIYGLDIATTAVSAVGTATAGSALAVGLIKNNDKIMGKKEPEGVGIGGGVDNTSFEKKKTAMAHARTGLMAASIATSGTSLGTSAAASVNAGKVAEKMKQCNTVVTEIRTMNGKVKALISDYKEETSNDFVGGKTEMETANNIVSNCKGFDIAGINAIKNSMTASAVISGIGTGTAIAGTTTSALANTQKMAGTDKQKKLDLTSNIMAGITTGTSLTTAAVSGAVIGKVKTAIAVAKTCESAL